jgi:excisionase family DNA binding protein
VVIELKEVTNPNDSTRLIIKFAQLFNDLYDQSKKDNYYWQYCPFDVYELYLKQTRTTFRELFKDATEVDFYKTKIVELKENTSTGDYPIYFIPSGKIIDLDKVLDNTYSQKIKYSHFRKIEFLESEIAKYNQPKKKKSKSTNQNLSLESMPDLITRREIADFFRIDIKTVDNWVKKNKLKAPPKGRRVYFKRKEVQEFIDDN